MMKGDTVGRPMEILMVEDTLVFAQITMTALKNGGIQHRLTWVTDGDDAIEFLLRQGKFKRAPRPDLVLLDLGLPKTEGRAVLARIRQEDELQNLPVVVMTASTDDEDLADCERLGVQGYLTKPVDLDKFLQVIKDLKSLWHEEMILPGSE
jgi:CheY-like chemotaxis protein